MRYMNPHMQQQMTQQPQGTQPMMNPQMMNPAMMNPQMMGQVMMPNAMMNPAMMNPQMMGQQGMGQPMFNQQEVRQMIAQAVAEVTKQFQSGGQVPAGQLLNPQMGGMSQTSADADRYGRVTQPMPTPTPQNQTTAGSHFTSQEVVKEVPVSENFVVNASATIKPTGHSSFILKTITTNFNGKITNSPTINITESFEESVESVIETSYKNQPPGVVLALTSIVNNVFYGPNLSDPLNALLEMGFKNFYKTFKSSYKEISDKHTYCLYQALNQILTDHINDFLANEMEIDMSIDNFVADFNELLKVLRDETVDAEDLLTDYVDGILEETARLSKKYNTEEASKTILPEKLNLIYLGHLEVELGLENLGQGFRRIEESALPNSFLTSFCQKAFKTTLELDKTFVQYYQEELKGRKFKSPTRKSFYLVTLDRKLFKVMLNEDDEVSIKKIN